MRWQARHMTMDDLQQIASSEQMISGAPVQASRTITINASIEKVWGIQTDIEHWPDWYAYLQNAELIGPFAPGAKLSYGGFFKHHLQIATVKSCELATIYGKYLGFSGVTKWEFKSLSGAQTQVRFSESSAGFMMSVLYSSEKLAQHLDDWLREPKMRAERK